MAACSGHVPVLLAEVIEHLKPFENKIVVDATFGAGGYTEAMLQAGAQVVHAFDQDPEAIVRAEPLQKRYGNRLVVHHAPFSCMADVLQAAGVPAVDVVVMDIGVSSFQLDDAARGFSFRFDGPLDMRMSRVGESAADVVNTYDAAALADIFWRYGEEKNSRLIARKIVERRADVPFTTTAQLVALLDEVNPKWRSGGKHSALRVFQALRIYVNNELGELEQGLLAATRLLKPGGRLAVVTFHSLEDRMVKQFMRGLSDVVRVRVGQQHLPVQGEAPAWVLPFKKAVVPADAELEANPRSRSAKLRVLAKVW